MGFELHPSLASKIFIRDLPLCRVLLQNERNYPWLLLIPRQPNLTKIMDLTLEDQLQLIQELDIAQKILWEQFKPVQLNVAAIGNKTPQLHVHVIARRSDDPAWPQTVWDHPVRSNYTQQEKENMIQLLSAAFEMRVEGCERLSHHKAEIPADKNRI